MRLRLLVLDHQIDGLLRLAHIEHVVLTLGLEGLLVQSPGVLSLCWGLEPARTG